MSGQYHVPAVSTYWIRGLEGAQGSSGRGGEEKNLLLLEIEAQ
jgi:hypothetical protein